MDCYIWQSEEDLGERAASHLLAVTTYTRTITVLTLDRIIRLLKKTRDTKKRW